MKKRLTGLVLLALLLTGCGECDHDWEKATCEEPKTCAICGETRGKRDKEAHDWEEEEDGILVCRICGDEQTPEEETDPEEDTQPEETTEDSGSLADPGWESTVWEIKYFTDDFGDPTEDTYLVSHAYGTFSNSVTTDSDLEVVVFFNPACADDDYISSFVFRLYEYETTKAVYYSDEELSIKIKVGDTVYEQELYGTAPSGDLYIFNGAGWPLEAPCYMPMYEALVKGEDVRCIIKIGSDTYSFTLRGEDFADQANAMLALYGYTDYDVRDHI